MDLYFEKVAVNYGYHVVKNPKQAEISGIAFIDAPYTGHIGTKWMTFTSKIFSEIKYEKLQELSELIAQHFKSESLIEKIDMSEIKRELENGSCKYGIPEVWHFSKKHSAFEEPPFITEGKTILQKSSYPISCVSEQIFLLTFQNYGGISKGLKINISFDASEKDKIELNELSLVVWLDKHRTHRVPIKITENRSKNKKIYTIDLPDFEIPEGINGYSIKLFGKKMLNETCIRSFSLRFIPKVNDESGLKHFLLSIHLKK